jgi:hypothetical protein
MDILLQTETLAPIATYHHMLGAQITYIEACENYQKRSTRNKYDILTAQGRHTLHIPLRKGKHQQLPIREVRIAYDEPWIKLHQSAIRSAYGKSPFFEYYYDEWAAILDREYESLFDLNTALRDWTMAKLKTKIEISETTTYDRDPSPIVDLRGRSVVDDIRYRPYVQVWQEKFGFVENLSILDLLLCMGPQALSYITSK